MGKFIIRRLFSAIPVFLGVSIVVFCFIRLLPGDPITMMLGERPHPEVVANLRSLYHLDKPLLYQYGLWISQIVQGNMGVSFITRTPIAQMIKNNIGPTAILTVMALILGTSFGIISGMISAVNRNTWKDYMAAIFAFIGISTPGFFLGIVLILVFSLWLRWLPPTGYVSPLTDLLGCLKHMILPAITLSLALTCTTMRMVRTSILEVLQHDFVRTARAKGLPNRVVFYKHVLRNALIPVITVAALQLAGLIGGATIIECVFAVPGIGRLTLDAIFTRDYPLLQACILMMTIVFVTANLVADVLYAAVDPRIRYD